MSFLKELLDEAVQQHLDLEDDNLEKMANDVSRELIQAAIQIIEEFMEEDPESGLELDEDVVYDYAWNLFTDMFGDDVGAAMKRDIPKYLKNR